MTPEKTAALKKLENQWNSLQRRSAILDRESAGVLAAARKYFPCKAAGRAAFHTWIYIHLVEGNKSGKTASRLFRIATCYRVFPKPAWEHVQVDGLIFLLAYSKPDQQRLLKLAREKAKELERPIKSQMISVWARRLEMKRVRTNGAGIQGESMAVLWLRKLYAEYNLPEMPEKIAEKVNA